MFNRICLAILSSLVSFSAYAADYKAAPQAAGLFNWSGLNIGLDVGYARQPMSSTGVFSAKVSPDGIFGCGHIGYDHQFAGNIVAGVVSDVCGGDVSGQTKVGPITVPAKADLFGTLRAKLGYATSISYPLLVYGTGGLAWSKNNVTAATFTAQDTQLGYAAGIGAEIALTYHWIVGVEWIYSGYGHGNYTFAPGFTIPLNVNSNRVSATASYKF